VGRREGKKEGQSRKKKVKKVFLPEGVQKTGIVEERQKRGKREGIGL